MSRQTGRSIGKLSNARQEWAGILRHLGAQAPCGTTADGVGIRFRASSTGRCLFFVGRHVYRFDGEHACRCPADDSGAQVEVFYKGVRVDAFAGTLS